MSEPIVPIEHIERRAREAFERGEQASANPYPWHSAAYGTWRDMYKRLIDEAQQKAA